MAKMMKEMEQPEMELSIEVGAAEEKDEGMYEELAPQGRFSKKSLNNLVKATNRLLPLFEQTPDYPMFADGIDGKLPTDFVRVLSMFQGAVNSAVASDVIDAEMDFQLEDLIDDNSAMALAGKLTSLSGNRQFRSFLKEPQEGVVEEEVVAEEEMPMEEGGMKTPEQMTEEEMDAFLMGRL